MKSNFLLYKHSFLSNEVHESDVTCSKFLALITDEIDRRFTIERLKMITTDMLPLKICSQIALKISLSIGVRFIIAENNLANIVPH